MRFLRPTMLQTKTSYISGLNEVAKGKLDEYAKLMEWIHL